MPDTLFFVSDDVVLCESLAQPYREHGWHTEQVLPGDPESLQRLAESRPLAAICILDGPSAEAVCAFAESVVADPRVLRPLMVFVGGSAEDIAVAKVSMPFAVFVRAEELPWVLKHLAFKS